MNYVILKQFLFDHFIYNAMFLKYWMFIFFVVLIKVSETNSQSDPCTNYNALADVTSKSDYILHFGEDPVNSSQPVGWVRYTRTVNGSLMTDCPAGTACGVYNQYWMNDSIPAEEEGIVPKQICGRVGTLCCDVELMINVKNCSDFVVYELKPAAQKVRYCFAADPETTSTSTTSTTITTTTTANTTLTSSDESGGINITIIAAIVGGVVLLIIIVIIVIVCVRKRKKRSIGNSNKDWQELNIAAIYRTKHKDLLIPRLMYQSGKPKTNASMVYLNPRDEDWIDMKELDKIPRTRSELEIFSPPEIDRLGIDISAVYQTRVPDRLVANTKFSTQRLFGNDKFSLYSFEDYMPYYDIDKIKFH